MKKYNNNTNAFNFVFVLLKYISYLIFPTGFGNKNPKIYLNTKLLKNFQGILHNALKTS